MRSRHAMHLAVISLRTLYAWAGLLLFLLSGLNACATQESRSNASASYTITSYSDPLVAQVVSRLADERVLYVFDIDSTLLAFPTEQFVGSDHWYQWQIALPRESPRKISCVFEMQAIAYRLQPMIATEDGRSAAFVKALQDDGHDVIALTARGHDVRYATERELARNGFDFSRSTPAGHPGVPSAYTPPKNLKLSHPREASFQNGVGMVAGQDKGAMLGDLLSRLGAVELYDYIVFFDDSDKNVKAVTDWFSQHRISTVTFHFQGEAARFPGHDVGQTDAETDVLLEVFEAFDNEARCLPEGQTGVGPPDAGVVQDLKQRGLCCIEKRGEM